MRKNSLFSKKTFMIVMISVFLVLSVVFGAALYIYPADKIARGISVGEVSLDRLTKDEAYNLLNNLEGLEEQSFILTDVTGEELRFWGKDISLSRDVEKTVESAYKIGREGDFMSRVKTLVSHIINPLKMEYCYSYDVDAISRILYDFGVSINGEMSDYTINYNGDYAEISIGVPGQDRDVSKALELVTVALDRGLYSVSVAMEKANPPEATAQGICEYFYKAPVDATYTIENGTINITDEINGAEISQSDAEAVAEAIKAGKSMTVRVNTILPQVTRSSLDSQLFGHTLGSFSSKYSTSNRSRSHNVVLAVNFINGRVIAPGETFSYNDVLGPRTTARGFKEAPVYSNGESVMGIGGGICQVSSTLYSAALYSDLEIVKRQNHSMTVDYVPMGQDATVSYGTIDFVFKNSEQTPIKITASASGGVVTVNILGTKPAVEKTVKIENKTVEVIKKTTENLLDESLEPGKSKVLTSGKQGYVVDTYKRVYSGGALVKDEYVGRSKYKMVPQKRAVGRKVSATPSPAPSGDNEEIATESGADTEVEAEAVTKPEETVEEKEETVPTMAEPKKESHYDSDSNKVKVRPSANQVVTED